MTELAGRIVQRFERMAAERSTWESVWQSLAEYILPDRSDFTVKRAGGEERTRKLMDMTAPHANDLLAAALHAMLTNPTTKWFGLRMVREELNRRRRVKLWLGQAEERLHAIFSSPEAGFAPAIHELYLDLGAFGTAVMMIVESAASRVNFRTFHLGECYVSENARGRIDTLYRKWSWTARQIVEQWGDAASEPVRKLAETNPLETRELIHAVEPRGDRVPGRIDAGNMAFASVVVERQTRHVIRESGYEAFPYIVPRWSRIPGEMYGRSPAWTALPDIKMVNAMSRTLIRAAQKAVDPPLLLPDEGVILPVRTVPGGLNFGGVDPIRGHQLIQPLKNDARIDIGLEMMDQRRNAIRSAFFTEQFQIIADARMTATEVLTRQEERLRLMAPMVGRLQVEGVGPLVERVFAIELRAGRVPPPPPEIQGEEFRVEYESPIAKAQRQSELLGIARTFELAAPFAQTDPTMFDAVDTDELLRQVADRNNFPPSALRDPRDVARIRSARAEQAAAEQAKSDAERLAAGAKDIAKLMPPGAGRAA